MALLPLRGGSWPPSHPPDRRGRHARHWRRRMGTSHP